MKKIATIARYTWGFLWRVYLAVFAFIIFTFWIMPSFFHYFLELDRTPYSENSLALIDKFPEMFTLTGLAICCWIFVKAFIYLYRVLDSSEKPLDNPDNDSVEAPHQPQPEDHE